MEVKLVMRLFACCEQCEACKGEHTTEHRLDSAIRIRRASEDGDGQGTDRQVATNTPVETTVGKHSGCTDPLSAFWLRNTYISSPVFHGHRTRLNRFLWRSLPCVTNRFNEPTTRFSLRPEENACGQPTRTIDIQKGAREREREEAARPRSVARRKRSGSGSVEADVDRGIWHVASEK